MTLDLPHGVAARQRVDDIVEDKEVTATLKPWYHAWCKRPTFSDEHLQAFNLPKVHLVDTDVLVLSTGFVAPSVGGGDPVLRSGIRVSGRNGLVFRDKWKARGAATLHGILSHDFPNLLSGAAWHAAVPMCTPGYMTNEGEGFGKQPEPEEAMKRGRAAPLSGGLISYDGILAEWREKGDLAGVITDQ